MVVPNRVKLSGTVEIDECYIGGKTKGGKVGRGSENKTLVAVAVELNGKKLGRIRLNVIKDAWEYKLSKYLWKEIIFDDPTVGVQARGCKQDWEDLPKSKSLFCAKPGCGIVIGNLTSQLLSNIYLDQLDRFVKHTLKFEHYGRYVDDFYLTSDDKSELTKSIPIIKAYLDNIGLKLHPKKILT